MPRQFNVVVLPDPVPPAMTKFAGRLSSPSIHTHIMAARRELTVPKFTRSIIVSGSSLNLRMVRVGPSGETGGMVPLTREPSGSRPSKIGTSPGPSPSGTLVKEAMFLAICKPDSSSIQMLVRHMPWLRWATLTHCVPPLYITSSRASSSNNAAKSPYGFASMSPST